MKAPQIIYIALLAIGLFDDLQKHGQPKTGTVSFWARLFGTAISVALMWWGGFWD